MQGRLRLLKTHATIGSPIVSVTGIQIREPAYWISAALAAVSALAALAMLLIPSLLRGPAVMNGSARGTALVLLAVALPLLIVAMVLARRGSLRALLAWVGALAFILYQSILFLFATPFNSLFLVYVGMLALVLGSAATLLHGIDVDRFAAHVSRRLPARAIATYILVIVAANGLLWLRQVVPALFASGTPAFLHGTGLTTNPIFVQDLGFWLPLMTVAAIWLWQRKPWGFLLAGSGLTMWVVESLSIAVDQWMGHAADPASSVASSALTPAFVALALIGLIPVVFFYRSIQR